MTEHGKQKLRSIWKGGKDAQKDRRLLLLCFAAAFAWQYISAKRAAPPAAAA